MALAGRVCTSCATPIPGSARTCPSCGAISLPGLTGSLGDAIAERLRTALGQRYRIERELGEGGWRSCSSRTTCGTTGRWR